MNQCTESAYGLITQSIQFLRIAMPLLQNLLYISQCHQDRAFTHAVRPKQKGYWRDLNWLRVLKGAKVRQGYSRNSHSTFSILLSSSFDAVNPTVGSANNAIVIASTVLACDRVKDSLPCTPSWQTFLSCSRTLSNRSMDDISFRSLLCAFVLAAED